MKTPLSERIRARADHARRAGAMGGYFKLLLLANEAHTIRETR